MKQKEICSLMDEVDNLKTENQALQEKSGAVKSIRPKFNTEVLKTDKQVSSLTDGLPTKEPFDILFKHVESGAKKLLAWREEGESNICKGQEEF